jgi:sodium pump decarboxylase gamma subunit
VVEGLQVTVIGMGLVFLALGMVILATYILEWAFRPNRLQGEPAGEMAATSEEPADVEATDYEDEAVVAAISLALVKLQTLEKSRAGLGQALETREPDPWGLAARTEQLRVWRG